MTFSEPTFLFFFLPFVLLGYFLARGAWRNHFLLAASLLFYAWGTPLHLVVILGSIGLNFVFGLFIARAQNEGKRARGLLALGVGANLALLGWYKYLGFFLATLGVENAADLAPALPIGISFFTFQALSYLVDLQAKRIEVQRDPFRLALYISMFPQLIAGPIVRYSDIETALVDRRHTPTDFSAGMQRFVVGLAKKTLIADPMGLTADRVFAIPAATGLSPEVAWVGIIAYTLQIYFDFSAYSDMAIGMGRMLGFKFPENFNYPYTARSITDFWRRWHMTLSTWFRDYLYIPLGGNRVSALRTYVNLSVVFLATGLWHGAAWNFVFWGAWHGFFLILERVFLRKLLDRCPAFVGHAYLMLVVILGWVAFRAETFGQTFEFYRAMLLGASGAEAAAYPLARYVDSYVLVVFVIGVLGALPIWPWMSSKVATSARNSAAGMMSRNLVYGLLFCVSVISVSAAAYSPFIYFRF